MSVACTLALTQDRACCLGMFRKPLQTKVKTARRHKGKIRPSPDPPLNRGVKLSIPSCPEVVTVPFVVGPLQAGVNCAGLVTK
jgi:hypothetical protein